MPPSLGALDKLTLYSLGLGEGKPVHWVTERVRDTGFAPEDFQKTGFWYSRVHRDDRPLLQRGLDSLFEHGSASFEYRFQHADGSFRWYYNHAALQRDAAGAPLEIVGSWLDITERIAAEQRLRESEAKQRELVEQARDAEHKRSELEAQLRQAQKMEALGRLTAGIAHDFNNLVSVTLLSAAWGLQRTGVEPELREVLMEIQDTALRAAALTRQLLAFSRQQVLEPRVLDAGALLLGMQSMLSRVLGADVELTVELRGDRRAVLADETQLEQVLMNLAVNARDAMPNGGKLHIEVSERIFDALSLTARPSAAPGPYVVISVADTGAGMDQTTLSHLFEPFYTTKEAGKGTGLGLSTSYGIVSQSGGFISVYSELGRGSVFRVCLPRQDAELAAEHADSEAPLGSETLLVLEDDVVLRAATKRALRARGYQVLGAGSRAEALAKSRGHAGEIALLVCDVVIAGESGPAIAAELHAERPTMRVLFASGLGPSASTDPAAAFLQKPFSASELAQKVRELLDQD